MNGNTTKSVLRIAFPDSFKGDRSQLKAFILQCNLYMAFHAKEFTSETAQVLWAVALLRGPAADWMDTYVSDFMESKSVNNKCTTETKPATKDIFMTWKGFTHAITQAFGDIDAKRTAERTLSGLT
jgi:hypothetical protein